MTALAMPEDALRCIDAGMDDHCSKPVDEALVLEKLMRYSKSSEMAAQA
jgi:CheY-like chemotaxis protein